VKPFRTPALWLAPIRASHLIQLDVYTDTRNFVHIWLPEGYGKPPHSCTVLDRTEDRRFRMEGDRLVTCFSDAGNLALRGEVWPIEDGVGLSLAVTNLSDDALPPCSASVCVQFAAAPSFVDTRLERYFYVHDGDVCHVKPPYVNYEDNHAWFYGTAPREEFLHNPAPDFAFVGLASKDSRWVAGMGWDTSETVFGNCHPSISCIHADPEFGRLQPGETALCRGVLYIMPGTALDCIARFRDEFLPNADVDQRDRR